jgi:Fe-S cluster assembly iron-binding protein IscA
VARSLHQQPAAPAPRGPRPAPRAGQYESQQYEPQPQRHQAVDPSSAFANNPLRLSAAAAAGIRLMQRQQGIEGVKVRVAVSTRGYQVDFTEDDPEPEVDFMYTCDGVTLLVDRDSAAMLTGVQMDLVHAPQGMGFVFRSVA